MSGIVHSLVPGLQNLGILSDKSKQTQPGENGLKVLEKLCYAYIRKTFDPSSPVDRTLDMNGRIIGILPTIPEEVDDLKTPSLWIPVKVCEICENGKIDLSDVVVIDEDSEQFVQNLTTITSSMISMGLAFANTLKSVAKSGKFDIDVVKSFLDEIVIFLDLVLNQDHSKKLPDCWFHFLKFAIQQSDLFSLIMEKNEHNNMVDLLHDISFFTDFQKEFLKICIDESKDNKMVIDEVGAACKLLLDLQEVFILKLIVREQGSNEGGVWC